MFRRMLGLKVIWLAVGLILVVGISVIAYSYFLNPVDDEVNVCLHLADYGCSTISHLTELEVGWVRTDWLVTDGDLMGDCSQRLQVNGFNLLAIIDVNTFGGQDFTMKNGRVILLKL